MPFGHVETGVCFSDSALTHNDSLVGCHGQVVDNRSAALQESLNYMSAAMPASLYLASGACSPPVVPHLVHYSWVPEGINTIALF